MRVKNEDMNAKRGYVLFMVLGVIFITTLIGSSLMYLSKSDISIIQNQTYQFRAFNHADAGVKYAMRHIESLLEADQTLRLADLETNLSIAAPADLHFDTINGLNPIDDPSDSEHLLYSFSVTGNYNTASASIISTFKRRPVFDLGIFGDLSANLQPGGIIYSYNSNLHDANYTPSESESTGEADVGSNNEVSFQPNVVNDGLVALGIDYNGDLSDCDNCESRDIVELDEAIDPDPLGIINGDMATMFSYVQTYNDNDAVTEASTGRINITPHNDLTLTAGNYYISDFNLKGDLYIDNSNGPVNIFLTGNLKFWPGSSVNVSGKPTDFMIFSNSSDDISVFPNSDFKGIVVAPNADIKILPNNNFYGTTWGRQVRLQPGGNVYIDTALQSRYLSNELELVSWKSNRDI